MIKSAPLIKISIYGPEEGRDKIYAAVLRALRMLREKTGITYKIHNIKEDNNGRENPEGNHRALH